MGGAVAALGSMGSAVGAGAKAAGSDFLNTAKNALFNARNPKVAATTGNPAPLPTDAYQDTTMGKLFGAGQPQQETAADRNRRMLAMQQ